LQIEISIKPDSGEFILDLRKICIHIFRNTDSGGKPDAHAPANEWPA
jgi:hypothetical protein